MEEIQLTSDGEARSRRRNAIWALLVLLIVLPVVLLVFLAGFVSIYWGDVQTASDVFWLIATEIVFVIVGVCAGRLALRFGKASLQISKDQIVVLNPWRTYRLPLGEVDELVGKPIDVGFGNPVPGVAVRLSDGSEVFVWTLANECFRWNTEKHARRWAEVAAMLNERVNSLRENR